MEYEYADHDLCDSASDGSEVAAAFEDDDARDWFQSGQPMGDWDH
jgi:hypothetical protein